MNLSEINKKIPLLIGTSNVAKAIRLEKCFNEGLFFPGNPASYISNNIYEEIGSNHLDIAKNKALHWSKISEGYAVSSDGGLSIPSLSQNWDSVRTHRFAGEDLGDHIRVNKILDMMDHLTGEDRRASWIESVALAYNGVLIENWSAESSFGIINRKASTKRIEGFWAAKLWYFPSLGKFYSELSESELEVIGDTWVLLKKLIRNWSRNVDYQEVKNRVI